MGSKFFLFLPVLFITLNGTVFSQQWFSYLKKDAGKQTFIQHLSWDEAEYAGRCEITIEKEENGNYTEVIRESTENTFIEVSLGAGRYRYQIQVYDLLDRPQGDPEWDYFDVHSALQPEIQAFSPEVFYLGSDTVWSITLTGQNLTGGAEIFLRPTGKSGQGIIPVSVRTEESGRIMYLDFDTEQLGAGDFDLYIKNPGGLDTSLGGLRAASRRTVEFAVSAGYAPLLPLYGHFFKVFDDVVDPLGACVRFSVIPIKKAWGSMGVELEPFWNFLDDNRNGYDVFSHIAGGHLNLLYQRRLPVRNLALLVRLGGGITTVLDYHYNYGKGDSESLTAYYVSAGGGACLQWFPFKFFFLEFGLEYNHIFTLHDHPHQGYIRPMIGAGLQF